MAALREAIDEDPRDPRADEPRESEINEENEESESEDDRFHSRVAEIEEAWVNRLARLRAGVEADAMLLGFERRELVDEISRSEEQFLRDLKEIVEARDRATKAPEERRDE